LKVAAVNDKSPQSSRVKSVLRYTMMPEILPRIRALGFHFGHFAYLLALVFASARLLPQNHPVLNAVNIGRYSVRQVIAMAANNITWSTKNIDQIAIFSAIVIGLIMIVIQAGLIAFAALVGFNPAQASGVNANSFFIPTDAAYVKNNDVALIFLAQVFGADIGFFEVATVNQTVPVMEAIRSILAFYSMAMMVIAVIIVLYYIMTVVGEAAKTGTPFGQRFNSLWAPIRLVVALGLLVPLGSGLNSAQYITLWAAESGSNFATNIWSQFARGITETSDLVSQPEGQTTTSLVQALLSYETCKAAFEQIEPDSNVNVLQRVGNIGEAVLWDDVDGMAARAASAGMSKIELIWVHAEPGDQLVGRNRRADYPYDCGSFDISLNEFDVYNDNGTISVSDSPMYWWSDIWGPGSHDLVGQISSELRQSYVAELRRAMDSIRPLGQRIAEHEISINATANYGDTSTLDGIDVELDRVAREIYQNINASIVTTFSTISGAGDTSDVITETISKGWGAAGIWFSNIGKINQFYHENANITFPVVGDIIEQDDGDTTGVWQAIVSMGRPAHAEILSAQDFAFENYGRNVFLNTPTTDPGLYNEIRFNSDEYTASDSYLGDLVVWLLGGGQLVSMRETPTLDPMAHLMGAGSSMVNRSLIFMTVGAIGSTAGAVADNPRVQRLLNRVPLARGLVEVLALIAPLALAIGAIGFIAGAMLFYVIPLMPFIYFAFAVMGWVMEIFEAIIAMPLWALSHLRIDGDGMPGQAAIQGYALIFMIFLRPALIVFGLIGGYLLFGAATYYLGSIFDMATGVARATVGNGFSDAGAMGMLVYTIIYVFLVYNIALMCFKMVDQVPNQILRWLGVGAQTFSDGRGDPIGGQRDLLIGGAAAVTTLKGGISGTRSAINQAKSEEFSMKQGVMNARAQGSTRAQVEAVYGEKGSDFYGTLDAADRRGEPDGGDRDR